MLYLITNAEQEIHLPITRIEEDVPAYMLELQLRSQNHQDYSMPLIDAILTKHQLAAKVLVQDIIPGEYTWHLYMAGDLYDEGVARVDTILPANDKSLPHGYQSYTRDEPYVTPIQKEIF